MTILDMLLIAALAVFVLAWWVRRAPARPRVLAGAALVALGAGAIGVVDDRWQAGLGAAVALLLLLVVGVNRLRKAGRKTGAPWLSGSLFAILAMIAAALIVMFPVSSLPKPAGSHPVGVRDFEVADAGRPGLLGAAPGAPRRLLVRVWYPAGEVKGLRRRPYFTQAEAGSTARTLGKALRFPAYFTYLKHARTNSWVDAPLAAGLGQLPVVIYSHGYTSFAGQNTALMEELASHGYVVFSLQHAGDSSATVFPNGDVAQDDPALLKMMTEQQEPTPAMKAIMTGKTPDERLAGHLAAREEGLAKGERITRSGVIWLADRSFLHDQLQAGAVPAAIKPILAASRLDRVGEMGMSFGGATAGSICAVDPRCAAGINLDGGDFPFQAVNRTMRGPFLMFHSDLGKIHRQISKTEPPKSPRSFNEFSYEPIAEAGRRADIYRVQLKGAHHLGLSDFSLFMRRPLRDPVFGEAPAKVMIGAQNAFVRGFFDRHLRGVDNGFPKPELAAYRDWVTPLPNADLAAWWAAKPQAERAELSRRIEAARRPPG